MKQKTSTYFFAAFIVLLFCGLLRNFFLTDRVKKKHFTACAQIGNFYSGKGGSLLVSYEFSYNTKKYFKKAGCRWEVKKVYEEGLISGLLVVGEVNNPENNFVIQSAGDLNKFNINEADTTAVTCRWRWW